MTRTGSFTSGLARNNPVAVMLLGLCPAAAVSGRVIDALWMSLGLVFVLLLTRLSQAIIHSLRAAPPPRTGDMPRTPQPLLRSGWLGSLLLASCFTASFELILGAFAPSESASLGIYIPLLAVNCIVLERVRPAGAESSGRGIVETLQEAGGLAVGFAICLIAISVVRESLGSGTITLFPMGSFGGTIVVGGLSAAPLRALAYAGGGLLCLGYLAGAARLWMGWKGRSAGMRARTEAGRA